MLPNERHAVQAHIDDVTIQLELKEMMDDVARSESEITDADLLAMEKQDRVYRKAQELREKGFDTARALEMATAEVEGRSLFVEGLAEVERMFSKRRGVA